LRETGNLKTETRASGKPNEKKRIRPLHVHPRGGRLREFGKEAKSTKQKNSVEDAIQKEEPDGNKKVNGPRGGMK